MRSQYIEDTVLGAAKDDELKQAPLANELAALAAAQPTPLNIAVFGPWGSGKSSLGVLLRAAIKSQKHDIRFVQINAWKHSQDSFRRQFILETARQLGLGEEHYRKRLYQRTKRAKFKTDASTWTALAAIFGVSILLFVLVMMGVAGLTATMSDKDYWESVAALLSSGFGSAVISAGLLAAVVALLGRLFTSDVEESEVSSEERFESLFKELVKKATGLGRKKRLVFFIDELDRCEPSRVVSVLESIRTFLDVKSCVFIVAADDRVLESAVKDEMPHAVPDEAGNPYYSSGAEYLDKLFQHQVAIPPLLARRLTQFAVGLTAHREGVWSEADALHLRENLVSVLVPSHVRSPRRAKVLLNGFVSTYESAAGRHAMDECSPDPLDRMLELAKLSTLRLEFPLFYRDLIARPHLAEQLTAFIIADCKWNDELNRSASLHAVHEIVEQYALQKKAAETMFSLHPNASEHRSDEEGNAEGGVPSNADFARRNELISYLRKTAHVAGPSRDIIFLESGGASFGVTDDVADAIETLAVDGDAKSLETLLEKAGVTELAGVGILHQLQAELVGIEAENTVDSSLRLTAKVGRVDSETAGALVEDIRKVGANSGGLRLHWLPQVIGIGRATGHPDGAGLVAAAIGDARLHDSENRDTAVSVLAAYMESPAFEPTAATAVIMEQSPGMLATMMRLPGLDDSSRQRLTADASFQDECRSYWVNNEGEVADDELSDFRALVDWANTTNAVDTLWWCLTVALEASVDDFINEWVRSSSTAPDTADRTGLLIEASTRTAKDHWGSIGTLAKAAPKTDSVALHKAASRVLADVRTGGTLDPMNTSLLETVTSTWGKPKDAEPENAADYLGAPWNSPGRPAGHRVVHRVANAEQSPDGPWRELLARDYAQLASEQAGMMSDEDRIALAIELAENWPLLSDDARQTVLQTVQDSSTASSEMKVLWQVAVAAVDGSVTSPFTAADVPNMSMDSPLVQRSVGIWLRSVAPADDIAEFAARGAITDSPQSFEDDIVFALARLTPSERVAVVQRVVAPNPSTVSERVLGTALESVDSQEFAEWLGEQLREATNDERRTFLLGVWRTWGPTADSVRKPLVEALTMMAAAGKNAFLLVLRNLDLAKQPPLGTKTALVTTVLQRAGTHGETKKAKSALAREGLGRSSWLSKRSGTGK